MMRNTTFLAVSRLTLLFVLLGTLSAAVSAQSERQARDTLMVLPFENTSGDSEFNWVGESIADSLTELLKVPGLEVVSNYERKTAQQRLQIPSNVLPSLAASLKLARETEATLLVSGRYDVAPEKDDVAASITLNAKIIKVNEGTFLSEEFPDGTRKTREIVLLDALGNLQSVLGQLAYQVLYQRDKALVYPQNHFIELATKVPARAFEAYIKGMLTPTADPETRSNFFRNALRIYAEENEGGVYSEAAVELGHLYLNQGEHDSSLAFFALVPEESPLHAEAAFFSGFVQWKQGNYEQALAVLNPLAEDLKLTSLYNNLGAISVELARKEKKDAKKSAKFLVDGLGYLETASTGAAEDTATGFNYGFALFLHDEFDSAGGQLRTVTESDPSDGFAHFLLAKVLEKAGDPEAAAADDVARRLLTENNTYAKLESEWKQGNLDSIDLRIKWPNRRDFVGSIVSATEQANGSGGSLSEIESLMTNATAHYEAGRDESAMEVVRRILVQEPMNAESYLLLGKIHLRRGDIEQALSSFKTALFWKNSLVEGHIYLGRIYIQKRDCPQASNYSRSALAIDPDNPEAVGLQRQVERCSR